eukprot:TRINITY_DN69019_c0_g1_i1.p1 TRINITY_DN69019_c0_g1~~TRINITY_DN69019_c0_g1_i1.p1  ORF type:complete len:631 (-),score=35.63 TRINITY_DN69019_c0_g1_i1:197-1915(-)
MHTACKKDPRRFDVHLNLGHLLSDLGRPRDAIGAYKHACVLDSSQAQAHMGLAWALQEIQEHSSALEAYTAAVSCPGLTHQELADCYFNLGNSLGELRQMRKAREAYEQSIKLVEAAETCNNLAQLLWEIGDVEEALRLLDRCCQLVPDSSRYSQNRLMLLNYVPGMASQVIFDAHRAWGEQFRHKFGKPWTAWESLEHNVHGKLRVGYISPDFFKHSTCYFARCLVDHHSEMFEVFLYSNTLREDDVTSVFKNKVSESRWRRVVDMSAQDVGQVIRADKIQVLVDLAGHTANNRLDVMALKPSPVQLTWCGYQNTTGLEAIDYLITDGVVDPVGTEQSYTEELARLPSCLACYTPPEEIPEVVPLPALSNGGSVTFGSFNGVAKLSPSCISLWSQILRDVTGSRLLIKAKALAAEDTRCALAASFGEHGISSDRLVLRPTSRDHLEVYAQEVDIALDTFPYSSPTTACEAMLMGVPVVCLVGDTHCSRRASTFVAAVGVIDECLAHTKEAYVETAKTLAADCTRLAQVRSGLRTALLHSPLCNGRVFVRDALEPLLQEKWKQFCEGRPPSA